MLYKKLEELINSKPFIWNKQILKQLPHENGVYAFCKDETILYIGQSKNLYDRIYNHHYSENNSSLLSNLRELLAKLDINDIDGYIESCCVRIVKLEIGRAELEDLAIYTLKPILNNFKSKLK